MDISEGSKTWKRAFNADQPSKKVHTFGRPPLLEAISLLPVAGRVSNYITKERSLKKEPIFDLNGPLMEPPNPGPYAGVPLGGLGGGSIGRGCQGEFRRWSLFPGRYIHKIVHADVFSIRVKRNGVIHATVLSVHPPENSTSNSMPGMDCSLLSTWDWSMGKDCATYYARFPLSWTVYENPVPGVRVIISQVSPVSNTFPQDTYYVPMFLYFLNRNVCSSILKYNS